MRLLVTGGAGQVGSELRRQALNRQINVFAAGRDEMDITNDNAVGALVEVFAPDLIVNAAAYPKVDKAETERDLAFAVNATGAENLARSAAARDIPLIHISTDYVFDGTKHEPYVENDPTCPVNVYGESKLAGEEAAQSLCPQSVIVRTAWVYGLQGSNFVKSMLDAGACRPELKVVVDQTGSPTFAGDLTRAILDIACNLHAQPNASDMWGVFHCANAGSTSWFGFANKIFALAAENLDQIPNVQEITTAQYPTSARRPANSILDCSKLAAAHGIHLRDWDEALAAMLELYFADSKERSST